jgi:prepilin-type N-terminal cleavage/methylation domain-containing protein/prepilin-type processing-associated H-X9-DG protein
MIKRRESFTLLEVLVVLAIIAVLAAFLMPALSGARERSRRIKCLDQLRHAGAALILYAEESGGWYPVVAAMEFDYADTEFTSKHLRLLDKALDNQGTMFACPSDKRVALTNSLQGLTHANNSYCYVAHLTSDASPRVPALFDQGIVIDTWPNTALLYHLHGLAWEADPAYPSNHGTDGGHMVFCDGHVEFARTFPDYRPGGDLYYSEGGEIPGTSTSLIEAPQERYNNVVLP